MLLHQFMNGALEAMHPSPTQKDTTFTKIFVGGLPYHTNDASLRKYFEAFGDIDEAVVITDRQTGKSRGYGFVSSMYHDEKHTHTCCSYSQFHQTTLRVKYYFCIVSAIQSNSSKFHSIARTAIVYVQQSPFLMQSSPYLCV